MRRVLSLADKHYRPRPRKGKSSRKPFPDWAEYTPNSTWNYDTTQFPVARKAVPIIADLPVRSGRNPGPIEVEGRGSEPCAGHLLVDEEPVLASDLITRLL